ncbi:hypothetical protein B0H67DRAFT_489252 [Lasiosphaeris hirsuta]|uniref:Steroid 5-alpha reductase C-terminal domain-containing protein n=1 Tax=Lasiosphaeris hirsuta TaxID=260670 RepID=A0AA40AG63_9PEZI|nr:hypothetical protein B0H67DRAFT_489252 [Lasiosphaeris hirsuta]
MSAAKSPTDGTAKKYESRDLIARGVYKSNPLGTATFIGLRSLDPILQFQLLAKGWGEAALQRVGIGAIPTVAYSSLSSLPLPRLLLLAMATGSTVKQIFWLTYVSKEEFKPSAAISVGVFNTVFNSLCAFLFLSSATSSLFATPHVDVPGTTGLSISLPTAVGVALYVVGIALETVSEVQRKRFKDAPKNKGKVCTTGLFGVARHINYTGYTLWRTGYALVGGGWIAGLALGGFNVWHFVNHSMPLMDGYMGGKYSAQWARYKKDVPWLFVPGIY